MDWLTTTQFIYIAIPLVTALGGGFIFLKLKIPVGAMLGSMIFVMVLSVLWGKTVMPEFTAVIAKIFAGILIGCRITRKSFFALSKIAVPIAVSTILTISLSVGAGFIIYSTSTLHKATALFGSAPGGVSDMTLISGEFGAEMARVALLQTIRIIICIIGVPIMVSAALRRKGRSGAADGNSGGEWSAQEDPSEEAFPPVSEPIRLIITIFTGAVGGILGQAAGIPAGALTGAIFFVAAFNLLFFKLHISGRVSIGTQILIGAVIGAGMTMEDILGLKAVLLPAAMIAFFMLLIGLSLGILLHKVWRIDLSTALIATAPGGMTQMALIAPEMEADVSVVASMHLIRLLTVLITYPLIMKWLI